jgi:hypothetical protein
MDAVPVQDPDTTSVGAYGVSPAKRPDCRPRARGCPPGLFTQVRRYVANGHHGFDESGILRSEHLLRTKG